MFKRLLRVLLGFAFACLAFGVTMVLFVLTPSEIMGLPPDVAGDRIAKGFELALLVAVQAALFSAPFVLVFAGLCEAVGTREWTVYVLAGLAIAALGFFAQHSTEQLGQPTIANNYALMAFLTAGFVGGLVYWLASGRLVGGRAPPASAANAVLARDGATVTAKGSPKPVSADSSTGGTASATLVETNGATSR